MTKIILFIIGLALTAAVFADNPCQSASGPYGPMTCTGGTTPNISANGPVTIKDTIVTGGAQVNGNLDADKATFNSLTVNGKVSLSQCSVKNDVTVTGSLSAADTHFNGKLVFSGNSIALDNVKTNDILVQNSGDGIVSPQTVNITGQSVVNGDITFSAKDGVVNLGPNTTLMGKVIGGKVVQQKAKPVANKDDSTSSNSNS